MPSIDELEIADEPEAWKAVGFGVEDGVCRVSRVRLRLVGKGPRRGIVGWALDAGDAEGEPAAPHPNGAIAVDHVVMLSPDLDRTVEELEGQGFDRRRRREGETPGGSTRQAFFRAGEPILEVVQAPEGTSVARDPGPGAAVGARVRGRGPRRDRPDTRRPLRRAPRRRAAGPQDRDAPEGGRTRTGHRVHDPRPGRDMRGSPAWRRSRTSASIDAGRRRR